MRCPSVLTKPKDHQDQGSATIFARPVEQIIFAMTAAVASHLLLPFPSIKKTLCLGVFAFLLGFQAQFLVLTARAANHSGSTSSSSASSSGASLLPPLVTGSDNGKHAQSSKEISNVNRTKSSNDDVIINADSNPCAGKEEILSILKAAGAPQKTPEDCAVLPTWSEVTELYGDAPVILGLDRCPDYRVKLGSYNNNMTTRDSEKQPLLRSMERVAGIYNSGTNALAQFLNINLKNMQHSDKRNVPWGKHVQLKYRAINSCPRGNQEAQLEDYVLPIVIVKDPYFWMQSICKTPYMTYWETVRECPKSLLLTNNQSEPFPVSLTQDQNRPKVTEHYTSLPDFWSSWYRAYLDDDRPRLILRYEDLLFHPSIVLQRIAECVGASVPDRIKYVKKRAKRHGRSRNLVQAIRRYGSSVGRINGLNERDQQFSRSAFDAKLMKLLHYSHPVPEMVFDVPYQP